MYHKLVTCSALMMTACMMIKPVIAGIVLETWDGGDLAGWVCYDTINEQNADVLVNAEGSLQVTFPNQFMKMPPEEYLVKAGPAASGGVFTGDLFAQGAHRLSFRILPEQAGAVAVVLGGAGKWWRCSVSGLIPNQWNDVSILIDPEYLMSLAATDPDADFVEMLTSVDWIGVVLQRADVLNAYSVTLDDFRMEVAGDGYGDWVGTYAGDAWEKLATRDLSGAGTGNLAAYIAGTDPSDAGSVFKLNSASLPGDTHVVSWPSVSGRQYQVLHSVSLLNDFVPLSGWLDATPEQNTYEIPQGLADKIGFIKINVRLAE